MLEIEEALHKLHASERAKREQDQADARDERAEPDAPLPPPFARVDAVTPGSPAYQAVRSKPSCPLSSSKPYLDIITERSNAKGETDTKEGAATRS